MYKIKFSGNFYDWTKREDVVLDKIEKTFPAIPRVGEYVSFTETKNRVGVVEWVSYHSNDTGEVHILVYLKFS